MHGVARGQGYLIGKMGDDGSSMWLQAQGLGANSTPRLSIGCSSTPTATADPASGTVSMEWNDARQELDVVLSHHLGAVEVTVGVW